jgi:hypothetical protein
MKKKIILGRREYVDLPEFGLYHFEAKLDTGAYTSAIHCSQIRIFTEDNIKKIAFHIPPPNNQNISEREFISSDFEEKNIRNSFGQTEKRYVIRTRIKIGKRFIRASFSLADRTELRYPVLIGRKILRNKFLVDVALLHTQH